MKTLVRTQTELCDAIRLAELKPPKIAPLPNEINGVPIVYRAICYFHYHDHNLPVRVNSFAFHENRYVDILEDKNGTKRILRYGVCSPCAESRGTVLRRPEDS